MQLSICAMLHAYYYYFYANFGKGDLCCAQ